MKKIWKYNFTLYKAFCYFVGTIVLIIFSLYPIKWVSDQFEIVELPNGIYIAKPYPFASYENLWLWKPDGTPLHEGPIEFVCFNDDYVHGVIYRPHLDFFIYSVSDDVLVYDRNDEAYRIVREQTNILPIGQPCDGHIKGLVGPTLLMERPGMVQEAREAQN